MSGLRRRLLRVLGGDPGLAARLDELTARVAELDDRDRVAADRQETLIRELAADLTERVAAFERRLDALESRDQ